MQPTQNKIKYTRQEEKNITRKKRSSTKKAINQNKIPNVLKARKQTKNPGTYI